MTDSPKDKPNPPEDGAAPGPIPANPWRPPILLATWFGSGLLPGMPGTWGSAAALPFAWVIHVYFGPWALAAAAGVVFFVGIWAADAYTAETGVADPGPVVIDEVAGLWLTLALAASLDPAHYVAGFVFFRLADILKPWPVGWADREIKGGLGVMVDDILAGLYAALLLYLTTAVLGVL
jgi:phosphatidylglycerophosphatase A